MIPSVTYRVLVFYQTLVVAAQADEEQDARDVLEAVYPLAALALLSADIDHQHLMVAEVEGRFGDADCPRAGMNDVLLVGNIGWVE